LISTATYRAQLEQIARSLTSGKTDTEIMNEVGVSRPTFYRYKIKIHKMFGDMAQKKTEDTIEFEAEVLKDRLLRLYRCLEKGIEDRDVDLTDKATAAAVANDIATNIFRLEVEGLRARHLKLIQIDSKKAAQCIGSIQSGLPESIPAVEQNQQQQQQQNQSGNTETQGKVF